MLLSIPPNKKNCTIPPPFGPTVFGPATKECLAKPGGLRPKGEPRAVEPFALKII